MKEAEPLFRDNIISEEHLNAIEKSESEKLFSVNWELRTILYSGILLFTSGIGVLIYKNIDTIGHQAVLAMIAAVCAGCFYYGYKHRLPYTNETVKYPSPFFDYVILLGCLLFGTFVGYLQFQYTVFGLHYGVAVLFPTLVFFFCAYFFDHKGILSLGITGLAAWAGFTATPMEILQNNDFSDTTVIFTGIILGATIAALSRYADLKNIKRHFSFSYNNFAANILFVSVLSALFVLSFKFLSFLLLVFLCYYFIRYAIAQQSFLFLLLSVLYGYIGLTYSLFSCIEALQLFREPIFDLLIPLYFMASCAGIILFFVFYKRILNIKK
ncbi:MAG TPA: DUF2157 domain-containing protein [Bacteroidia bacterium]